MKTTITVIMCYQMWKSNDGCHIAGVNGRGIGVRPMIFFKDNKRVASAQESAVLVSAHYTRLQGLPCTCMYVLVNIFLDMGHQQWTVCSQTTRHC